MPALNIRDVTPEQMALFKASAALAGMTLRDWSLAALVLMTEAPKLTTHTALQGVAKAVALKREAHDPKTCRVYACGMCAVLKK